jgi:hypothetical protein
VAKSRTFGGHEKNRAFWTEEDDGAIVEGGRERERWKSWERKGVVRRRRGRVREGVTQDGRDFHKIEEE